MKHKAYFFNGNNDKCTTSADLNAKCYKLAICSDKVSIEGTVGDAKSFVAAVFSIGSAKYVTNFGLPYKTGHSQ